MSAANPVAWTVTATGVIVASTTLVATATINTNEVDEITVCINTNVLANLETILVSVFDSASTARPYYWTYRNSPQAITATPVQAQLTGATGATIFSLVLPGGPLYLFTKTATASAVGMDVFVKPRNGLLGG